MRTRKSNIGKSFKAPAYFSNPDDFGDDPDEESEVAVLDESDDDDGFEDDGNDLDNDDADEDEDDLGGTFSESGGSVEEAGHGSVSGSDDSKPPKQPKNPREVQPYPTDTSIKWTRAYMGHVHRYLRIDDLVKSWFGDKEGYEFAVEVFLKLWGGTNILPPRISFDEWAEVAQNPWMPLDFEEDQVDKLRVWYDHHRSICTRPQLSAPVSKSTASRWYLPQFEADITVFLGPHYCQEEIKITQGQSIPLAKDQNPLVEDIDNDTNPFGGWLLDVGGIAISMGWAPRDVEVDQFLAMSVIPFSDQAFYETPEQAPTEASMKQGCVQIWKISAEKSASDGYMYPAKLPPKLISAHCFEWGRALRMQWCPVELTGPDRVGLLAVLTNDNKVRVLEINQPSTEGNEEYFEEIEQPVATFEVKNEYMVTITCFTWVNMNRIAVGHSDGSVALWSIYPCMVLMRHPVHTSSIIDISSSYPSHPFIVTTVPLGGVVTVTDLNRPNGERNYCSTPVVSPQANMLAWSEVMRGFVSMYPSSFPGNVYVAFYALRVFPQARMVLALDGQPTCLAVGTSHPYLLAGSTDGSLYIVNVFNKVCFYRKKTNKLKLFHHEYIPSPPSDLRDGDHDQKTPRGSSRILHGFREELNGHAKFGLNSQLRKISSHEPKTTEDVKSKAKNVGKNKNTKKKTKKKTTTEESDIEFDGMDLEGGMVAGDMIVSDPLTRITAVCWNPNLEFSWWAAAAMGSGLVKIMDLGSRWTGGSEEWRSRPDQARADPSEDLEDMSDESDESDASDEVGESDEENDEGEEEEEDEEGSDGESSDDSR